MTESTTSQTTSSGSGAAAVKTESTTATTGSTTAQNVATGGVYVGNVIALIHWLFSCIAAHQLIEPDELTTALLGLMFTHIGAKIGGWWASLGKREPSLGKAAMIAKIVAAQLEAAGVPAMAEKIAAGGSLTLTDKAELLQAIAAVTAKVEAIPKAAAPSPAPAPVAAPPAPKPAG